MKTLFIAAALGAACLAQRTSAQDIQPVARPLSAYAGRHVILLPTQYLRPDTLGVTAQIADGRDYLANVDAEIAFALGGRGLKDVWVFPAQLEATAKRNKGYIPSPYGLAAQWLRPPGPKKLPEQLPDPLGGQLRQIMAGQEDTEYALMPVEVRFEPAQGGGVRALLRMVMFDARRAKIVWTADISSKPSPSFGPALATTLAEDLADLIAAP